MSMPFTIAPPPPTTDRPACNRCGTKRYEQAVLDSMAGRCYKCHDQTTYWYCK